MQSHYEIFADDRLVVALLWGPIGIEDMYGLLTRFAEDARPTAELDGLIDLSLVTEISCSFAQLQALVDAQYQTQTERSIKTRTAIVAPSDLTYGFARMYQALNAEICARPVDTFRTRREAFKSLGRLDLPRFHLSPPDL